MMTFAQVVTAIRTYLTEHAQVYVLPNTTPGTKNVTHANPNVEHAKTKTPAKLAHPTENSIMVDV